MRVINKNERLIGVVDADWQVQNLGDVLDVIGEAGYAGCEGVVLAAECLPEAFFDLSSRMAGDFLQKFVNYRLPVAIVGDFSHYPSKHLQEFIYESNQGKQVFFMADEAKAMAKLTTFGD